MQQRLRNSVILDCYRSVSNSKSTRTLFDNRQPRNAPPKESRKIPLNELSSKVVGGRCIMLLKELGIVSARSMTQEISAPIPVHSLSRPRIQRKSPPICPFDCAMSILVFDSARDASSHVTRLTLNTMSGQTGWIHSKIPGDERLRAISIIDFCCCVTGLCSGSTVGTDTLV